MVRRIFVEKKEEYAVFARELAQEIHEFLGLPNVGVRYLIRYDVENVSDKTFRKAEQSVFSEPPVDDLYEEKFTAG